MISYNVLFMISENTTEVKRTMRYDLRSTANSCSPSPKQSVLHLLFTPPHLTEAIRGSVVYFKPGENTEKMELPALDGEKERTEMLARLLIFSGNLTEKAAFTICPPMDKFDLAKFKASLDENMTESEKIVQSDHEKKKKQVEERQKRLGMNNCSDPTHKADEVGMVDEVDEAGQWTPVLYACLWDWAVALQLLIKAGAKLDVRNFNRYSRLVDFYTLV